MSRADSPLQPPRIRRGGLIWLRLLLAGLMLACSGTHAASLQVDPILIEFAQGEQSQALWVSNTGTETIRAQVRISRWTQRDGEESLEPSRELIASPAIIEIPANERQLIRLIRSDISPSPNEAAYRLIVDELPGEQGAPQQSGLQFLLRYSIPAFVLPRGHDPIGPTRREQASAATPRLSATLSRQAESGTLRVTNPDPVRVRLSSLSWEAADGTRTELVPGLLGYVLGGQTMQWEIALPAGITRTQGQLRIRFNDDTGDQVLPLEGTAR